MFRITFEDGPPIPAFDIGIAWESARREIRYQGQPYRRYCDPRCTNPEMFKCACRSSRCWCQWARYASRLTDDTGAGAFNFHGWHGAIQRVPVTSIPFEDDPDKVAAAITFAWLYNGGLLHDLAAREWADQWYEHDTAGPIRVLATSGAIRDARELISLIKGCVRTPDENYDTDRAAVAAMVDYVTETGRRGPDPRWREMEW
jgi:hypothetical protein